MANSHFAGQTANSTTSRAICLLRLFLSYWLFSCPVFLNHFSDTGFSRNRNCISGSWATQWFLLYLLKAAWDSMNETPCQKPSWIKSRSVERLPNRSNLGTKSCADTRISTTLFSKLPLQGKDVGWVSITNVQKWKKKWDWSLNLMCLKNSSNSAFYPW